MATSSEFKVQSITVTNQGSGYTSAPAISFNGGGGTGAAATANLGNSIYNQGPYTSPNPQPISGVGGGVSAYYPKYYTDSSYSDSSIYFITDGGPIPSISWSGGGGGSGFSAQVTYAYEANRQIRYTAQITNGGSGYTSASWSYGGFSGMFATVSNGSVTFLGFSAGNPQSFGIDNSSTLGTFPLTVSGNGSGATGTMTLSLESMVYSKYVTGVSMISGGSGYTSPVTMSNNRGWNLYSTCSGSPGGYFNSYYTYSVTSVTVNNQGSKYSSAPSVSFSGGGGSGAAATAVMG